MKYKLAFALFMIPFFSHANLWGVCPGMPVVPPAPGAFIPYTSPSGMIPCDMGCMGASGIALGVEFTKGQIGLVREVSTNMDNWSGFLESYIQYVSDYSDIRSQKSSDRMAAFSAVTDKISGSIEILALTKIANTDHITSSIVNFKKEQRLGDQLIRNIQNYNHPYTSYKYNKLLVESVNGNITSNLNTEKSLPLAVASEPKLELTALEKIKSLYSLNNDSPESDVNLTGSHLSREVLDSALYSDHAVNLGILFSRDRQQVNVNNNRSKFQKQAALSVLLNAQVIENSETTSSITTTNYIANLNIESYIDGSSSMANEHGLNLGIVTTQALQNTLLNDYLKLKREKNALKATINL